MANTMISPLEIERLKRLAFELYVDLNMPFTLSVPILGGKLVINGSDGNAQFVAQ